MKRVILFLALVILLGAAGGLHAQNPLRQNKIALTSNLDGSRQIYVMNLDGSQVGRLTTPPGNNELPGAFSPDGRKIVFTSDRDGSTQIYVMSADGSNVTRLTTGSTLHRRLAPTVARSRSRPIETSAQKSGSRSM